MGKRHGAAHLENVAANEATSATKGFLMESDGVCERMGDLLEVTDCVRGHVVVLCIHRYTRGSMSTSFVLNPPKLSLSASRYPRRQFTRGHHRDRTGFASGSRVRQGCVKPSLYTHQPARRSLAAWRAIEAPCSPTNYKPFPQTSVHVPADHSPRGYAAPGCDRSVPAGGIPYAALRRPRQRRRLQCRYRHACA